MNCLTSLSHTHLHCTNYLKATLEELRPKTPERPLSRKEIGFTLMGRAVDLLPKEIGCRAALLADRCVRLVCSILVLLASLPSPLLNRLLPENCKLPEVHPSWEKFSTHARFLMAETFELVGVVVCSTLLLFSDVAGLISPRVGFQLSKPITSAQIKVEKIAERISGEKAIIDHYQSKRAALRESRFTIHLCQPFTDSEDRTFIDKAIDYDDVFVQTAKRRISRRAIKCRVIEQRFNQMLAEIEDKLLLVIPFLNLRLEGLGVQNAGSAHQRTPWEEVLCLQKEIEMMIAQLHRQHDPHNELKEALDHLKALFSENYHTVIYSYDPKQQEPFPDFTKRINEHFFDAENQMRAILALYSYEMGLPQDIEADFRTPIFQKIAACEAELKAATQRWHCGNYQQYDQITPDIARSILGVDREADPAQVKAAYYRLARLHHPDKGGNPDHFILVQRAYKELNPT